MHVQVEDIYTVAKCSSNTVADMSRKSISFENLTPPPPISLYFLAEHNI